MKTHLMHGAHTACGIALEVVGDQLFARDTPNGSELKVTAEIHGVSCARCRKSKWRNNP